MRGVPFLFFLAATICVTVGMFWGIQMSASGDHTLSGAHAHLNLVGWVTLGVFGLYYHATPQASGTVLSKVHLAAAVAGVALMVPGIVMARLGMGEALAIAGSLLTVGSMVIFLVTVVRHGLGLR